MPKKKKGKYYEINTENAFTEEQLDTMNEAYTVTQFDLAFILPYIGGQVYSDYKEWMGDIQLGEIGTTLDEPIGSPVKTPGMPSIKVGFNPAEIERGKKIAHNMSDALNKYMDGIDDVRKPFISNVRFIADINDASKSNTLRILCEDPLLANLRTQSVGASPEIFLMDNVNVGVEKVGVTAEHAEKWTKESGIQRNFGEFFEAADDVLNLERNRDLGKRVKKNWTAEKERDYLAGLENAYTRLIDNFEELRKVPEEEALRTKYMGNSLSHLTGVGEGESRDAAAVMGIAKLKRDAIRQGWSSDGLNALQGLGHFAGLIDKKIYQAEIQGKDKDAQKLTEWKEKNLNPFMQEITGKKITKASDMMDQIGKIESFYEKIKNDQLVASAVEDTLGANMGYTIPKCKNQLVDAMEKENKLGKPQIGIGEKHLKTADYSDNMKMSLDVIKSSKDAESMKDIAAAYIVSRYMHGKSMTADGDLFNTKRFSYEAKVDRLQKEAEHYAKEMIEKVKPANGKELAFLLENGNHSPAFSVMKQRIKASDEKSVYNDFVKGKISNQESKKSVDAIVQNMKKADEGVVTFNTRFGDVMRALPEIEDSRREIVDMLRKATIEGKPFDFESKKFKEFEKKVKNAYSRMDSYMEDKDAKIRQKGGDPNKPEDIALLGKNGANRYKAMDEAGKKIRDIYRLTVRLKEKAPTTRTEQILTSRGEEFIGRPEEFKADCYRERFRQERKKLHEALSNEADVRKNIKAEYDKGAKNDKTKLDYENKMVDSATRSLYVETVTSLYNDKFKAVLDNPGDKELGEKVDKLMKDFNKAIKESVVQKDGKLMIKGDSAQLQNFKSNVLAEGDPFKTEFKTAVVKEAGKTSVRPGKINKLRDEALDECLKNAKNKDDMQKYEKLSNAFGSNAAANFKTAMEKQIKNNEMNKKKPVMGG